MGVGVLGCWGVGVLGCWGVEVLGGAAVEIAQSPECGQQKNKRFFDPIPKGATGTLVLWTFF
jgi:hypothetical protein